jgi:hypothetical protein
MTDWRDTTIWRELGTRSDDASKILTASLELVMPQIQTLLRSGGTTPLDFTLHDDAHSYRVAERMWALMPEGVPKSLSTEELALLLLAAYTHDIGMTPERGLVQSLNRYLLAAEDDLLGDEERRELQRFLDDVRGGQEPPITTPGGNTAETVGIVNEITANYARERHVVWGIDWVDANLVGRIASYAGFVSDLTLLIRSHHEGFSKLVSETYSPRLLGEGPRVVNRRYLAVVLRVADVLEFDPERTPSVIFHHRSVSHGSEIYWHKDKFIQLVLEGDRIVLSARPPDAQIHEAVRATAAQVAGELEMARRLADQVHFDFVPGMNERTAHRWSISGSLYTDIQPEGDSYEFIDGAFRPDSARLLELLTGTQLYSTSLAAVRELLQNAFDAVKEQMARERLEVEDPTDPHVPDAIAETHRVDLRLETDPEGVWLVCTDTGVGMTKKIIRDQLLVTGSATRYGVRELERRCLAAGFTSGRTGTFGIGVLSYFMLADRLELRTRRSLQAGDPELTGWHFVTGGLGSFGELRKDSSPSRGTEVRLHVRADAAEDPIAFFDSLRSYLRDVLRYLPCRFRFTTALPGRTDLIMRRGWAENAERLWEMIKRGTEPLAAASREIPDEYLSVERRRALEEKQRRLMELQRDVQDSLDWEIDEGELPEQLGLYRLYVPVFRLPGGESLIFLRITPTATRMSLGPVDQGLAILPRVTSRSSWRGMAVNTGHENQPYYYDPYMSMPPGIVAEVEWQSPAAGSVSVDRERLRLSPRGIEARTWLRQQAVELHRRILQRIANSPYAYASYRFASIVPPASAGFKWAVLKRARTLRGAIASDLEWKDAPLPAVPSLNFAYEGSVPSLTWRGRKLNVIPSLPGLRDDDHYDGLAWPSPSTAPDKVLVRRSYELTLCPVWLDRPVGNRNSHAAGLVAAFPPAWAAHVAGVRFASFSGLNYSAMVWNPAHPMVEAVDAEAQRWVGETFSESLDPIQFRAELVENAARAAAWLMRVIADRAWELWEGLEDREPGFQSDVWRVLFDEPVDAALRPHALPPVLAGVWHESTPQRALEVLLRGGRASYRDERGGVVRQLLYPVPPAWQIQQARARPRDLP